LTIFGLAAALIGFIGGKLALMYLGAHPDAAIGAGLANALGAGGNLPVSARMLLFLADYGVGLGAAGLFIAAAGLAMKKS